VLWRAPRRLQLLLQDENGQVSLTHSVSAGLDYAMIGPEHALLHDQRRADTSLLPIRKRSRGAPAFAVEGIIPALESAHAAAEAIRRAPAAAGKIFLINLSGRGDKDIDIYRENFRRSTSHDAHRPHVRRAKTRRAQESHRLPHRGDPTPERTPALVEALLRGGADLIELGVPFSDPIADGPVIQRAGERALKAGTSLRSVLEIACEIRQRSEAPLLLFTYLNPVLRYGLERLARDAAQAGIGWLPAHRRLGGRGARIHRAMHGQGLDTVFLPRPLPRRGGSNWWRLFHRLRYLVSRTGSLASRIRCPARPRRWCAPCAPSPICRWRGLRYFEAEHVAELRARWTPWWWAARSSV